VRRDGLSPDYRIAGFHTMISTATAGARSSSKLPRSDWPCAAGPPGLSGSASANIGTRLPEDIEYCDLDGRRPRGAHLSSASTRNTAAAAWSFSNRLGWEGARRRPGSSPCEGLGPGTELFYVVTPRLTRGGPRALLGDLVHLGITENRRIRATSTLGLNYEFGFDLKPLQVTPADGFKSCTASSPPKEDLERPGRCVYAGILGDVRIGMGRR